MSASGIPHIGRGTAEGAKGQRTDPRSFLVSAVGDLPRAILPLAAILYSTRDEGLGLAVVALIAAGIIGLVIAATYLSWSRTTYTIGADDIRVESGIFSREARSVPYDRIQDVSLEQSLLPRLFDLVEVRFETGAGGKDELTLAYLAQSEGERLRELVRARHAGGTAAESQEVSEPAEEVLFTMPPRRVLTFGAFEFSLAVVAVLGGLAQQFDFLLPFDLWDLEEWQARLAGPGAWLAGLGPMAQAVGAAIAVASLLLTGFVTGIVRTALREWDFTLTLTPRGFRRRRGLLTRTDVVMPVHRVQALHIGTGVLRRLWGWHSLEFASLAQDAGSASHVVAPFAKREEIAPIIAAAGWEGADERLGWQRTSKAYARHRAATAAAGFALLAFMAEAVISTVANGISPLLHALPAALALLAVLLGARELLVWRRRQWALSGSQLFYRHGRFSPKLHVASRVRLQSVELARGPLARRGGYATLQLGVAGTRIAVPGVPVDEARSLRGELLASMVARDFSELV